MLRPRGRPAEDGRLAQGAGEQDAVAGLPGPGGDLLGVDGQHQPVPHAGAVVEGPELSPDKEGAAALRRRQQRLWQQHRQDVRRAGEPGHPEGEPEEPDAVVFVGERGRLGGDPLQQHLIAGLNRHVVHLSVVMVHLMRRPAGIDLKIPGIGTAS